MFGHAGEEQVGHAHVRPPVGPHERAHVHGGQHGRAVEGGGAIAGLVDEADRDHLGKVHGDQPGGGDRPGKAARGHVRDAGLEPSRPPPLELGGFLGRESQGRLHEHAAREDALHRHAPELRESLQEIQQRFRRFGGVQDAGRAHAEFPGVEALEQGFQLGLVRPRPAGDEARRHVRQRARQVEIGRGRRCVHRLELAAVRVAIFADVDRGAHIHGRGRAFRHSRLRQQLLHDRGREAGDLRRAVDLGADAVEGIEQPGIFDLQPDLAENAQEVCVDVGEVFVRWFHRIKASLHSRSRGSR